MERSFFDKPLDQSQIKANIVSDYYPVWSTIISKKAKLIGLIDLYCGPGQYDDGTDATPLLVLDNLIKNHDLSNRTLTFFNDKVPDNISKLTGFFKDRAISKKLRYPPILTNLEVSDEILERLESFQNIPVFSFLDPWGYKGLSLKLIKFAINSWGSECLFFFNYNRINAAITNPSVESNINALLGKQRVADLREKVVKLNPFEREVILMDTLCMALNELGGKYVLPFCFKHAEQEKTSHYLIFVGKHPLGYGIVKEIMAKHSERDKDGIPSFTYDPKPKQLEFTFNKPFDELLESLKKDFQGQTLSFSDIYKRHQQKTRFVKQNYKDALLYLERKDDITVDKSASERPVRNGKVTLGEKRIITFK
ncbi:MAG: three-Cys-motif partner protein TcmP [Planctomycetes bacterium]|nr:three-Cys-motif partner protein TcmP [Planctomycetota bacterium]